jgi:hypothetical protein
MKRKLVGYEVFQEMKGDSLSNAINEIVLAEEHIAEALGEDGLEIVSYDTDTILYEATSGTFYHANYAVTPNKIELDAVQQIVIDEESEQKSRKKILSDIVESLIDDNKAKATEKFDEYLDIISRNHKIGMKESYARLYGSRERTGGKGVKIFHREGKKDPKKVEAAKRGHRAHKTSYKKGYDKRHLHLGSERIRRKGYASYHNKLRSLSAGTSYTGKRKRHMNEWVVMSENVFGYVNFNRGGNLFEAAQNEDNTLKITIPTLKVRNEGKIIKIQHDVIKNNLKYLRESVYRLPANETFCKLVGEMKRQNNLSDDKGLQECIEKIVAGFPGVLYSTRSELARIVAESLESVGILNFDDNICGFMAEGILIVAHETYAERANKFTKLAEIQESDDKFADFQKAAAKFLPVLDESIAVESKMYHDLFDAVSEIRTLAVEYKNDLVKSEASNFMSELKDVLNGNPATLELAEEVALWLQDFVETNLSGEDWEVTEQPYVTYNGDHPAMFTKAKKSYVPSSDFEDEHLEDEAPFALSGDAKGRNNGKELRDHGWGNKGGKDVFPDLTNPHVQEPLNNTMLGEKGVDVDGDESLGQWQGETYPEINNPYIPKAFMAPRPTE